MTGCSTNPALVEDRTQRSLRREAIRGGVWLVLGDALTQAAGLIKIAIISRLLGPKDFGLLGIALLVQRWVDAFSDTGVVAALIQKRGDITRFLDTAWSIQVIRGLLVTLALVALAGPGARFFHEPLAAEAVCWVALGTFLWGLVNPAVVYFRKDLRFRSDVMWRSAGILTAAVVSVVTAWWLRNARALLIGLVVGRAVDVLASYVARPYRPRLRLHWAEAKDLMRFGRWITLSNMALFLETQLDSLAIGHYLTTRDLGFYQVSGQFASPLARVGINAQGVLFPALSKLEEKESQRQWLFGVFGILASVLLPIALFFQVAAQPIVGLVLGNGWSAVSAPLVLLIWAAVARTLTSCTSPLFLGVGRPDLLVKAQAMKLVVLVVLLTLLLRPMGIAGAAVAVAVSCVAAAVVQLAIGLRLVGGRWDSLALRLRGALLGGLPALVAAVFLRGRGDTVSILCVAASLPGYLWVLKGVAAALRRQE